ncbi:MAG: hypothetical protein ACKVWV_04890 [Planctomycetota bacterium]
MVTCENCGTNFTPSTDTTEVTSLRILCASCDEKRRLERAARARAKSTGASAGAASARAGASAPPPVPATKSAVPAAAPRKPAADTSSAAASAERRPPSRPAAPAPAAARAPVPPPAAEAEDEEERPAARSAAGRTSPKSSAAPRPSALAKKHAAGGSPDVAREIQMLRKRENKVVMYGWIACVVLLSIAGGLALRAKMKRDAAAEAIAAYKASQDEFRAKLAKYEVSDLKQASEAIAYADEKRALWADEAWANDISSRVAKARTNIDLARERKELEERLLVVEETIQNAATRPPDEVAKVRRTLGDLELNADKVSPEFKARVQTARAVVDKTIATRLHDEARAIAAKGPNDQRAALTAYTKAEDEALRLFEESIRRKTKENEDFYKAKYREIIAESDALATAIFTPEVVDKAQWKDLLSTEAAKGWQHDGLADFGVGNGQLRAVGLPPGAGKTGIMSVGDREQWRDFVLDAEFIIEAGSSNFFFRLGRRADNTVENFELATGPGAPLKAGESYGMQATFIGSKLSLTFSTSEINPYEIESSWSRSRKGAFGITVPEGSTIKITKLKIRELR